MARRSIRALCVSVLASLLVVSSVGVASAATVYEHGTITMGDLESTKEPTYVVTLVLAQDTALPASVSVPVPAGVELAWAGEVFGGDSKSDIVAADAKLVTEGDHQVVQFTATKSRTVQVETTVPKDMLEFGDDILGIDLYWPTADVSSQLELAVLIPAGVKAKVMPEGAKYNSTASGGVYYRSFESAAAGDRLELALELVPGDPAADSPSSTSTAQATTSAPAASPAQGASDNGGTADPRSSLVWGLVGALALTLAALAWVLLRSRRARG